MDDKERQSAFLSALSTEHYVLQAAASATISEAGARASLYVYTLSSGLVAMGFAARSAELFWIFTLAVLCPVFVLGVFTMIRLVETMLENQRALIGIARIRGYYRSLTPEAAKYFSVESARWPERAAPPNFIAFWTTSASMIGVTNSIIGGAFVTLVTGRALGAERNGLALWLGVAASVILTALSIGYQWREFRRHGPGTDVETAHSE